ncbi:MAG TPA: hypothetical protein VGT41_01050 [Candidatus Babeliales bacterium]|nr:hypothetical protein [Candidatus Babeliales bacterium]
MVNIQLSETHKGILCIVMGAILLLYTLGIVAIGLFYIIIGFAVYLIVQGCMRTGLDKQIKKYISKKERE